MHLSERQRFKQLHFTAVMAHKTYRLLLGMYINFSLHFFNGFGVLVIERTLIMFSRGNSTSTGIKYSNSKWWNIRTTTRARLITPYVQTAQMAAQIKFCFLFKRNFVPYSNSVSLIWVVWSRVVGEHMHKVIASIIIASKNYSHWEFPSIVTSP